MLIKYLWKHKWTILLFIALSIFASIMLSLFAIKIASIFDAAELGDYQLVLKLFVFMFFWYLFIRLTDYYTEICGIYIVNKIRKDIKNDLFATIIYKELPDFTGRNSGEYIAEFTNDITIIETKFLIPFKELVSYLITIVTVCVAIVSIDIQMMLVIFIGAVLCLLLPVLASKYTSNKMIRFIERFDKYVQYLKDNFGAFFTFKNYAVEEKVVERFLKENSEVEQTKYNAELALVIMNNLIGRLAWLVPLFVVVIGLHGVLNGTLTFGSVFSAYLLAGQLGQPLQGIGNRISMIRSVGGIEKKFKTITDANDKNMLSEISNDNVSQPFNIRFENVSLKFKDKIAIDNFSYTFEAGKKYLIIGSNGSGKSTTVKILKNTYRNYDGKVLLGNVDLKSPKGALLSEKISYSNETVAILSDTVKNNILLYRDIENEELYSAIRKAEFNVPLDRQIGDGGRFLSSGERRKLEIARALVKKPQILILDEVVSTLDIETAFEIEKLVLDFDATVIMVSNAFSGQLLEKYDGIIIMNNGKIIAEGTHSQLIKNSQEYRDIYEIRCGNCFNKGER